ncbi:MAG TPA: DUF4157 domain-containing protein [Nostocaceae cyanobacterium]|nr:DUF4157 domain-containing protein [Nostocaceae cyanobacterium]
MSGNTLQLSYWPEKTTSKNPLPILQRKLLNTENINPQIQRQSGESTNQEKPDLEHQLNSKKGGGSSLDSDTRSFMESRFGADFSAVRVHTDSTAVQMNRELGAQAFTHGSDIFFRDGKTPGKNELTAHELTHVIQQTGAVQPKTTTEQPETTDLNITEIGIQRACLECEEEQKQYNEEQTPKFSHQDYLNKDISKPELIDKQTENIQPNILKEAISRADQNKYESSSTKKIFPSIQANVISQEEYQFYADLNYRNTATSPAFKLVQSQINKPLIQKQADPRPKGKSVNIIGVAFRDPVLELYSQPSKSSPIVKKLSIGTKLFIDKEIPGGWYHIAVSTGEYGYVEAAKVNTRLPEPGSTLHKIKTGETALKIAHDYYRDYVKTSQDLRYYINVLYQVNQAGGAIIRPPGTDNAHSNAWEKTQVRAGLHIWIPSPEFAKTFVGKVSTGSGIRDALAQAGKVTNFVWDASVGLAALVAGLLQGALEALWSNLVAIKDLLMMKPAQDAANITWDILKSAFSGNLLKDSENLWKQISSINWQNLAQAWWGNFQQQWNDPNVWKRCQFRGRVIGYAAIEIALSLLTFGGATGAKWAGKIAGKAIAIINKIPGVAKLAAQVKKIPVPSVIKRGLQGIHNINLRNQLVKGVSKQLQNFFPNINKFLKTSPLKPDDLKNFLKIANEGLSTSVSGNISRSIARKIMQHSDIPGLDRWIKLASRHVKDQNQLLDLANTLDDAIKLRQSGEKFVELEAFYSQGKKLTNPADIAKAKTNGTLKNIDVVTSTMRREFKRVNKPITNRKQLLSNIRESFKKFKDAQLKRGAGGQKNVGVVDFGNQIHLRGQNQQWAFQEIQAFLIDKQSKAYREFADELVVKINGVDHVFPLPPP